MIDFEATLKTLSERGVSFVVVGGYATTLHGSAYLTRDLAICYERTPENMERLVSALVPSAPARRDIDLLGHLSGLAGFSIKTIIPIAFF